MKITFCCTDTKAEPWLQGLAAVLPGAEISVWQPGAPQADYAVVWAPPQRFMDEQAGLKALFNIGAGVDALLKLRLPPGAGGAAGRRWHGRADGRICVPRGHPPLSRVRWL